MWARLRNCGESESSSGKVCQAEDSGEAGGVPGGEPPGEKSYNRNREGVCPQRLATDTRRSGLSGERPVVLLTHDKTVLFFFLLNPGED